MRTSPSPILPRRPGLTCRSCFAFGGSEVICVAASETLNPRRNIPKAVRRTFWRVLIFYVFGVLAIGVLVGSYSAPPPGFGQADTGGKVPYNDPGLNEALQNGAPGAAASPWVAAIVNAGIGALGPCYSLLLICSSH